MNYMVSAHIAGSLGYFTVLLCYCCNGSDVNLFAGEFLIRRGAKRAARSVMQDAIAAWAAISAVGKASQLTEKHEWLLKTATSSRCADVGVQTVDSLLGIDRNTAQEDMAITQDMERDDRKQLWIEQNGVTAGERSLDISSVGLGRSTSLLRPEVLCY